MRVLGIPKGIGGGMGLVSITGDMQYPTEYGLSIVVRDYSGARLWWVCVGIRVGIREHTGAYVPPWGCPPPEISRY